jgi:hypothetical protein
MFERFTRDARAVVVAAQEAARSLDDSAIRATHLLLGLAGDGRGTADLLAERNLGRDVLLDWVAGRHRGGLDGSALSALGIDLAAIRSAVESTFGPGALDADPPPRRRWPRRRRTFVGHLPFTDGARKSLELALREAIRLGRGAIDAEVVLLGVLRSDDPEVRQVLAESGVDVAALRRATESRLRRAA